MTTAEQQTVLEALENALLMEKDGKECYLQAAAASKNEAAKKFLTSLAKEEENHQTKLEEVYRAISANRSWPEIEFDPSRAENLKGLLAGVCQASGVNVEKTDTEMDALNTAIDKEKKSVDFYKSHASTAKYEAEKEFYEKIAGEESEHELVLVDFYEYMTNPPAYFVMKERHSLDGG